MTWPNKEKISNYLKRLFAPNFAFLNNVQMRNNGTSINLFERFWYKKGYTYSANDARTFMENMYQGIMPFTHMHPRQPAGFSVSIDPANQTIERMIAQGLNRRSAGFSRLEDSVCEFVRFAAMDLFSNGLALYQIVDKRDDQGNLQSFELESLRSENVIKIFGSYYQFNSPSQAAIYGREEKAQIIKVQKNRIIKMKFPKELGGRRKLYKMLKRLTELSTEVIPEFQMTAFKDNKNTGFDFEKYRESKNLEAAYITRRFGWNHGELLEKRALEHYFFHRYLRSKMAQVVVRDYIIDSLNEALNGRVLNLNTRIILNGVPNRETIREEINKLRNCGVNLGEIFNRTKLS